MNLNCPMLCKCCCRLDSFVILLEGFVWSEETRLNCKFNHFIVFHRVFNFILERTMGHSTRLQSFLKCYVFIARFAFARCYFELPFLLSGICLFIWYLRLFSPFYNEQFIELVPTNQQHEHQPQSSTFLHFHLTHFSFRTTDVRNLIVFLLAIFEKKSYIKNLLRSILHAT